MKYIGTILYGIIEIIILLAIFNFTATPAESLIITILILVYITLRSIGSGLTQVFTMTISAFDNELTKLKLLLGHPEEDQSEYKKEIQEKVNKNKIKFYIQSGIILILYVMTIIRLIGLLT
jgi:hypothetical protein